MMFWDIDHQIRHAAMTMWPMYLDNRDMDIPGMLGALSRAGYNGGMGGIDGDSVIEVWKQLGWITTSPNGVYIRLTPAGYEQWAHWKEEDQLWRAGPNPQMPLVKRLIAGEPAKNLRKIQNLIGNSIVTGIHDPYTTQGSLHTILKLVNMETKFSQSLRLLGTPIWNKTEKLSLIGFLRDINTELKATWEVRTYTETSKPHRRFLVLDDGSVVTCGMSLNHIDKDEVLDREHAGSEHAKHDHQFFEDKWKLARPV